VPEPPDLPDVSFDWSPEQWRDAGRRLLDLAESASTGWDTRRPSPPPDHDTWAPFRDPLPRGGSTLDDLVAALEQHVVPASTYNGHPRFFAYISGAGLPIGVLGDMVASALNQNTGLWRLAPAATALEMQTVDWIREMLGYPPEAEGVFISGGQMANVLAYGVFRQAKVPWDVRALGMRGPDGKAPQVRVYAGEEVHYCHQQAAEFLGMGRDAIRLVPVDDGYRMRTDALVRMVAEDRDRGDLPLAIAATAGTVGTGAIDPLPELVRVARDEDLWLHVDGAYGAFAAIAESAPSSLRAIGEADSIACDPHKWLYAPVDAGVTLVRTPGLLNEAFAFHATYLETQGPGTRIDMLERTPENSRRLRALKVWLAIRLYGRDGYAAMIERNLRLSEYMARVIEQTPDLVLAAPRELSIACWRAEPPGVTDPGRLERLQTEVIAELEARGIAMVSNARLRDGRGAIRACIVNFRTQPEDVRATVDASAEIARELAARSDER
jgi:aromatic-L-amino-acid/L-tryptophan decarboxylase